MLDVRQLYDSITANASDINAALAEYQAKRVPESFALMRIVSVRSSPSQGSPICRVCEYNTWRRPWVIERRAAARRMHAEKCNVRWQNMST